MYAKKSCPRTSLDAGRLVNHLLSNEFQAVSNPRNADLIFVFTCGGFSEYEERSILTIQKALKNKSAKIIVTGCLPKQNPKRLDCYRNIDVVPKADLGRIDKFLQTNSKYSESAECSVVAGIHDLCNIGFLQAARYYEFKTEYFGYCYRYVKNRVYQLLQKLPIKESDKSFSILSNYTYKIQIARGCLGNCSYCGIKLAMPKFRSYPEECIVEQFKLGLETGYRHFAILAGDIGCYGLDIKTNLSSLLDKLFAIDGDYKIVLVDLNVRWFIKYYSQLRSILKLNFKKVAKIIVPIQSGSNRILRLMSRHYKIEDVKKCIRDFRMNCPQIDLETHLLVGFPGETIEDFRQSLDLVREIKFSFIQIYGYDDRPSTVASELPGKVPRELIKKRIRILEEEAALVGARTWSC